MPGDPWQILESSADAAARRLLGSVITRELPGGGRLAGRIVETEAYDQTDAASHSYRGRTPRTDVMFGPAGRLYVYFTYGMHYCANIVTGREGHAAAVLIRAIEPLEGAEIMAANRGNAARSIHELTNGPAKFCQAFGIDTAMNGHDLLRPPVTLELGAAPLSDDEIVQTTRIGISQAKDVPWRFYIRGNPFVSKP